MTDIVFPNVGDDPSASGVVVTWFVESGDHVEADTLVAEVAISKVDAEVRPGAAGTITVLVPENTETAQGTVIATIE